MFCVVLNILNWYPLRRLQALFDGMTNRWGGVFCKFVNQPSFIEANSDGESIADRTLSEEDAAKRCNMSIAPDPDLYVHPVPCHQSCSRSFVPMACFPCLWRSKHHPVYRETGSLELIKPLPCQACDSYLALSRARFVLYGLNTLTQYLLLGFRYADAPNVTFAKVIIKQYTVVTLLNCPLDRHACNRALTAKKNLSIC